MGKIEHFFRDIAGFFPFRKLGKIGGVKLKLITSTLSTFSTQVFDPLNLQKSHSAAFSLQ
jgi:hypothetical protein